jgi:hypothetical protein
MEWQFICPLCGHVASGKDYKAAGAPGGAVAYSCIGRWLNTKIPMESSNKGPCNYAGGGLFNLNPVEIEGCGDYFELAPPTEKPV